MPQSRTKRATQANGLPLLEAIVMLGITRERGIRWITSGRLEGWYDGSRPTNAGLWYFSRRAVRRELAARERQGAEAVA